jgi:hypothetical protein
LIPPDPSIITWLEEWTPEEKLKKEFKELQEFKEFKEEEPGARSQDPGGAGSSMRRLCE